MNNILEVFDYNQHFVAMMNIINAARLNPPTKGHKHHIIPKCWFKMNNLPVDNSKDNLVLLTCEDHQKVHRLSVFCVKNELMKSKMGFAVHYLHGSFSGLHHTEESRRKMSEAQKGRICTDETRRKRSDAMKGKTLTEEHRRKIGNSIKGRVLSEEWRRKISESLKGKRVRLPKEG